MSSASIATRRRHYPLWLWGNLLALDAPLVAVAWQLLLANYVAHVYPGHTAVLALSVWLVYTADHILDGWSGEGPLTPRHQFASDHRIPLSIALSVVFLIDVELAAYFLSPVQVHSGLVMLAAVIAYFAWMHLVPAGVPWPKELCVAVIFAAGVWEPAIEALSHVRWIYGIEAAVFLLLCWWNCVAIETWEGQGERWHVSTAWLAPKLPVIAASVSLLCWLIFGITRHPVALAEALSAAIYFALARYAGYWPRDMLRVAVDAALLTPLLLL